MKEVLLLSCFFFPILLVAQPSPGEVKKFKIKKVIQEEDGKYGTSSRTWYYSMKGDDSMTINGSDTMLIKYVLDKGRIAQRILSRVNATEEDDHFDYAYNTDGSYKTTFTDGHFKMRSYQMFDVKGRMLKSQSPDGNATTYKYDAKGNLLSMVSNGVNKGVRINNKYSYNSKGQLIKAERSYEGMRTTVTYFYNGQGKLIKDSEKGQLDDDALENISLYEYNEKGLLKKRTDKSKYPANPKEEVVTFEYSYTYEYY